MAEKKQKLTNREWLAEHKAEYDKMLKDLGYANPTQKQISDVIAYLRKQEK